MARSKNGGLRTRPTCLSICRTGMLCKMTVTPGSMALDTTTRNPKIEHPPGSWVSHWTPGGFAGFVYAREPLDSGSWDEKMRLIEMHAQELRGINANLDIATYRKLETKGLMIGISARRADTGELVGYCSAIWHPDLHYQMPVADDDSWYVLPEYRCYGIGKRLREKALEELRTAGVKMALARVKLSAPHDTVLSELGFVPYETVWRKDL
ncbi:MAG: hypothetical protein C5B60_05850 [Chloroflexi bacterium]|nr:MAG: hypothetical protein C5B60_05850 [Chloroflexota bacterium]